MLDPKVGKQLKGGQLFANDIVKECRGGVSDGEAVVLDGQWNDMVRKVKQQIQEFAAQQLPVPEGADDEAAAAAAAAANEPARPAFDLGNLVPLVDVSGSMTMATHNTGAVPMDVAIAMGLVVSELTHPAYQGRVLTFESQPRWHKIKGANIAEKVKNLIRAPWGGSTNFRAAMRRIIDTIEGLGKASRTMPSVPDLIVFSDMQFDVAGGGSRWDTAYDTICRDFAELGQRLRRAGVEGVPATLVPPTITFWNINSNTTGLVAEADTKGVRLLSGYSQSLLKLLLSGALPELAQPAAAPVQGEKAAVPEIDPLETLHAALDDKRYDLSLIHI